MHVAEKMLAAITNFREEPRKAPMRYQFNLTEPIVLQIKYKINLEFY